MASTQMLKAILSPYGKEYAMTDYIIQLARLSARKQIFGDPFDNVKYTHHVKNAMLSQGHHVTVQITNRKETIKNVQWLVVAEELLRLKVSKQSMSVNDRKTFAADWIHKNEDLLLSQLGSKNEGYQFVHAVFFALSFATETVPNLQRVFMADACHLNFGKYTLFSCYGRTANANMSPVAFAIIFGNENGASWNEFWKYAKQLHPTINAPASPSSLTRIKVRKLLLLKHLSLWNIFIVHIIAVATSSRIVVVEMVRQSIPPCGATMGC